jgi:hypothetical protein
MTASPSDITLIFQMKKNREEEVRVKKCSLVKKCPPDEFDFLIRKTTVQHYTVISLSHIGQ